MKRLKIKIEHQPQANKPIYLLHNGSVVCGEFQYQGTQRRKFQETLLKQMERDERKLNLCKMNKHELIIVTQEMTPDEVIDKIKDLVTNRYYPGTNIRRNRT
jgi:hypothetical protein